MTFTTEYIDVWLQSQQPSKTIDTVYGSAMPIAVRIMDWQIPQGAQIQVAGKNWDNPETFGNKPERTSIDTSANAIIILPEEGLFTPGMNWLQIEIKPKNSEPVKTFRLKVKCEPDIAAGDISNPQKIQGYAERAEEAAKTATDVQADLQENYPLVPELNEELVQQSIQIAEIENVIFEETVIHENSIKSTATGAINFSLGFTLSTEKKYDITVTCDTPLTANCTIIFRGSSGNLNDVGKFMQGETEHKFEGVTPTGDAIYVRFSSVMVDATYGLVISEKTNAVSEIEKRTSTIENDISNLDKEVKISDLYPVLNGYWNGIGSMKSSNNRARLTSAVRFDKETVIATYDGNYLCGYIGTQDFRASVIKVPANTDLYLYVRRINEVSTDVLSPNELFDHVYILNYRPLQDYVRLYDTFYGIEMFRTAGFIGDSYTARRLGLSWVDVVKGKTGVDCRLFAKSGDTTRTWLVNENNGLPKLLEAEPLDMYWVALCINDSNYYKANTSYLGSEADLVGHYDNYPDTYWGNMGRIIENIMHHATNAKIILYKPIYKGVWRTLGGSSPLNEIGVLRDALEQIANHYNIPWIDALDDVFFHTKLYEDHMDSDISAGNHPSVMLYSGVANANLRLFSKCVDKFDSYFMGINYDGTTPVD